MTDLGLHDFAVVAEHGDSYEFHIDPGVGGTCRLVAVVQTERGPRRNYLAEIPGALWRMISARVVRELADGMGEAERLKAAPKLKNGANRLSPLIGRELALLLWALQEEGATDQLEAILHGWRELAREERWWLYAKAAAPGQRVGIGWRRALFHALSEVAESRAAAPPAEKKSPAPADSPRSSRRPRLKNQARVTQTPETNPARPAARKRKTAAAAANRS
jgi:hypothetical protein